LFRSLITLRKKEGSTWQSKITGLDWWTEPVDWTGGLTFFALNITSTAAITEKAASSPSSMDTTKPQREASTTVKAGSICLTFLSSQEIGFEMAMHVEAL